MRPTRALSPSRRRRHLQRTFDERVQREWERYEGSPRRLLTRTLRERFLRLHLAEPPARTLELGPGPGRFTPTLRQLSGGRVIGVDLSRQALRAARRRVRGRRRMTPVDWVQAAGEHLPLESGSVDAVVALGNVVSFAALEGPALLREMHRVLRPGGRFVADFASPVSAMQEFFYLTAASGHLHRILKRPAFYFVGQVLRRGYQPYAPHRSANWEFRFYTAREATRALDRAGFRVTDVMSAAPIASLHDAIAAAAHRSRRTWETLLRLEEESGRRPGVLETGHGFLVAAVRR